MSGHSKWATIKHKKGAADKARAKVFNKIARQLEVAAREGGGDPATNASLRTVILKAKGARMTNDAIDRAVKRGAGVSDGGTYESITYEGYAYNYCCSINSSTDESSNELCNGHLTARKA